MIFIVVQLPEFNIIVWPIDKIFTRQNFVSPSVCIFLSLFLSLYVWHSLSLFPSLSFLSIYLFIYPASMYTCCRTRPWRPPSPCGGYPRWPWSPLSWALGWPRRLAPGCSARCSRLMCVSCAVYLDNENSQYSPYYQLSLIISSINFGQHFFKNKF